ncbi:hypothetical protein FRC09_004177 [Ceratobasidium sp. 395]|nr:hypothetical protein FRC09_004177 [Ceratobasidium sp. 395]
MAPSKKTRKAPTVRRSRRLKKQPPPTSLSPSPPAKRGRGRPPKTDKSKAPVESEEQGDTSAEGSASEVDELAEDSDAPDAGRLSDHAKLNNHFMQLAGALGDETLEDALGAEGYEDEDSDVSSQETDDEPGDHAAPGSIIEIESSRDGSSFYLITEDHCDSVSTPVKAEQVKQETHKHRALLLSVPSSSPPTPASDLDDTPKGKGKGRQSASKRKRVEEDNKPQVKKTRGATASQKKRRKKVKGKADEDEDAASEPEEEPEDMLNHFFLHIPAGDPDDATDRATKSVQAEFGLTYKDFRYLVAEQMDLPVGQLPRLSYKFSTTRTAMESLLRDEAEYTNMLKVVRQKAEVERDRAVQEKGGQKGGRKPSKSVMKAKQMQQPCDVYLCRKVTPAPKGGKKGQGSGQASNWAAAAMKPQKPTMTEYVAKIKELNTCKWPHCNTASGFCREIVDPFSKATAHRALSQQNIELWANMVVQGSAKLYHPPSCIRLFDNKSTPRQKSATTSSSTPVASQSWPTAHVTSNPIALSSRAAHPPSIPTLVEWLAECDATGRGAPGVDNFSSMIFGFQQAGFVLLNDLRGIGVKDLRDFGLKRSDGSDLNMLAGTAHRLTQFVKGDLEAFDQTVLDFAARPN